MKFDVKNIRKDFPILKKQINGKQLIYFDNAATSQTPTCVINSISNYNCEILYQKNNGYGDALIHGINICKTKYFCIFNADGSFNPTELNGMLNKTKTSDLDFNFASRYQRDAGSEDDTIVTLIGIYP